MLQQLKATGEAPYWLTEDAYNTLFNGNYSLPDETPKGMWERVCKSVASYQKDVTWESYFDLFWKNWLCGATPVLANIGTSRGLPASCFGVTVDDSLESIYESYLEVAMLTKNGGGLGKFYGDVRGRGTPINGNGGVSEGIIPWLKIDNSSIIAVSQSSVRRGSLAAYLGINHPDIEEFIDVRRPLGDPNRKCLEIYNAVCIPNSFMQKVEEGDQASVDLWLKLLQTRIETGAPYIQFDDNINNNLPEAYVNHNLKVKHSNLCVASETKILTDKGEIVIKDLENQKVNVWNGKEWSETQVIKTSENQELMKVTVEVFDYTYSTYTEEVLECTAYHKWYDKSGKELRTTELTENLELESCLMPNGHFRHFKIKTIESLGRLSDTYCVNESKQHKAVFNGVLTGNCSEIMLPSSSTETYVCVLSSLNLAKWDEWKDSDAIRLSIRFLDGVCEEFLHKARGQKGLEKAVRFVELHRALGLGVLGFHSLLQSKNLAFDSLQAKLLNQQIFRTIRSEAEKESSDLAFNYGSPYYCRGLRRRNTTLLAVAPTTSNALISSNVSQSIEPWAANIFSQQSAKGTFIRKNPILEKLLKSLDKDTPDVWSSINEAKGSVAHLEFLTDEQKNVFKTAREINQHVIVTLAADRQVFIDQGQSLNLFFNSNASEDYIHEVHLEAWKKGLKTLYYLRSEGVLSGDSVDYRSVNDCVYCES